MKWPLQYQIMAPMAIVMFATVAGLSALGAYFAAKQKRQEISQRIEDVAETLARANFPLTEAVLHQMKGLAGADFILVDHTGDVVASTQANWRDLPLPPTGAPHNMGELQFIHPLRIEGQWRYHAALNVQPPGRGGQPATLHVFYSQAAYHQERRQAIGPPLIIGGVALVVVVLLAMAVAAQVSRPLKRLQSQVEQIAQGKFAPMPLPRRNDEVRQLAVSVNRMAAMLAQYEDNVRRTERMRTLGQLGGGLAHQLRNSATGAKMALDIHRSECPQGEDSESLDVAAGQLALTEKHLQKFLSLGSSSPGPAEELDLGELVRQLLPLVQPAAKHSGVALTAQLPQQPLLIKGDADALEQIALNLLLNGIEAASSSRDLTSCRRREVCLQLAAAGDSGELTLVVENTGPPPPSDIEHALFEPFVTNKHDGAGLGLAVVKEAVARHGGEFQWGHRHGRTRFVVKLPRMKEGIASVEVACS